MPLGKYSISGKKKPSASIRMEAFHSSEYSNEKGSPVRRGTSNSLNGTLNRSSSKTLVGVLGASPLKL